MMRQLDPRQPSSEVASETRVIELSDGRRRKIVEGQVIPSWYRDAYAEAGGEQPASAEEPAASKRFASDAAEARAAELGLSLEALPEGSGKDGGITVKDINAAAEAA